MILNSRPYIVGEVGIDRCCRFGGQQRDALRDGAAWRERRVDHGDRLLAVLDHDLRTGADPRQQPSEVAGRLRFRDVDHMVSHGRIIASLAGRGDGGPLGQELAGFSRRRDSASFGIPDAFIDGSEGFLVFVEDGSGVFEIEFLCLRLRLIVDGISDRCNGNGYPQAASLPPFRKERERMGHPAWMDTLRPEQIFLSAVTIGELQAGAELTRKNDPAKAVEIESWLTVTEGTFPVIPMDSACFREWARLRAGKSSELIEDAMIAATARIHGLHVATRNERDFRELQVGAFNPFGFEK